MTYSKDDVDALKARIIERLPNAKIENWRDFGFALDVSIGSRSVVACQPKTSYQDGCFRSADEVERLLTVN
jgi:hypothetical protein